MPIYEYECRDCELCFERKQGIHESPLSLCPRCGGTLRRVIQPVGIVFKGSGFYCTDNRPRSDGGDGSASLPPGKSKDKAQDNGNDKAQDKIQDTDKVKDKGQDKVKDKID